MTGFKDIQGESFGRWRVLRYLGGRLWLCECDCGAQKGVNGGSLRSGRSQGCIACHTAPGTRTTHGQKRTRLYNIWRGMKARCENPNDRAYPRYGGRRIQVDTTWRNSFEAFRDWALAEGYKPSLTLDRFPDKNGDYEPSNCRWATYTQQNRNRRNNRIVVYAGREVTIAELAEISGVPYHTLKQRLGRYGWPVERAVMTAAGG